MVLLYIARILAAVSYTHLVGGVLVTSLLAPFQENWGILFIAGMLITSIVEYITGFLLEKLFHTKWWDYSQKKFNLHGRVCLKNSLLFGVMSVLVMKVIFPPISRLIDRIPSPWLPVIAVILIVYFAADTYATVRSILQLNGKLAELERALEDLRQRAEEAKKHRLEAVSYTHLSAILYLPSTRPRCGV